MTEVVTYPTGFKELIGWLAAGSLIEIDAMEPFIRGWAIENGCHRVRLTTRKGFAKAFAAKGYRETMVILTKDLADGHT